MLLFVKNVKFFLSILLVLSFTFACGQTKKDTLFCNLENAPLRASINNFGFAYGKMLYISKDSLRNGFTVVLSNPNYKIVGFTLFYDCEGCDIWVKTIYGNKVSQQNVSILRKLKNNEVLEFGCLNIEIKGKRYLVSGFAVQITD